MKRFAFLFCLTVLTVSAFTQPVQQPPRIYRASADKINDLVHTRLDARFDYSKSQLNGKVWITLKPHFYPTDSLTLDAKGMDIHSVAIVKGSSTTPLKYKYDGWVLNIDLD